MVNFYWYTHSVTPLLQLVVFGILFLAIAELSREMWQPVKDFLRKQLKWK